MKGIQVCLLLLTAFAASGCNTTRGFGQDVEAAGDAIEDKAEEVQDDDRR
jgi:predicted small secreted protein